MKRVLGAVPLSVAIFTMVGCAQQHQIVETKYPRAPQASPERRSGPAMFFYEEAEKSADVNNVIVIPPSEKKTKTPLP